MEVTKKKIFSIILIVVCLTAAVLIIYKYYFSSNYKPPATQIMKCTSCGEVVEMDIDEFSQKWDELRAKISPLVPAVFECPKCGKKTLKSAKKCKNCGEIFNLQTKPGDYSDRCPKCGYSSTEELIKSQQ